MNDERIEELEEALTIAISALEILSDWHSGDIQVYAPSRWELWASQEDELEGWCSISSLCAALEDILTS
jgi:hypothetical protein